MTDKEHFFGLEWLRFLLGLYIVLFHTLHNYPQADAIPGLRAFSGVGFFATSSFFILSGFLLAHVYARHGHLREPARQFWLKRFSNLYPLHLFSLLLTVCVIALISHLGIPPDDTKASLRFVVYDTNEDLGSLSRESLEHWMSNGELALNSVLQLLMLQAWNPYYLTFPFLAPRLLRLRHKGWWLLGVGVLYMLPPLLMIHYQAYGMPFTGMLHRWPLLRLPEFLAGILLYGLYRQQRDAGGQPGRLASGSLGLFCLGSFVLATQLLPGAKFWYYLLHNGLLMPAQLALIYLCAWVGSPTHAGVWHWSRRLGAASLPLFALHVPAFTLFSRAEKVLAQWSSNCWQAWAECARRAGEQPLALELYPLYLLFTVLVCLLVQERAVIPVRKLLLRHMLSR